MSALGTVPSRTQRPGGSISERPYQVLMLDVAHGRWSVAEPPPLVGAGQSIEVVRLGREVQDHLDLTGLHFEGVCVTEDWLRIHGKKPLIAQLALLGLIHPLFLLLSDSQQQVDEGLPLSALLHPLSAHVDQARGVAERLLQGLKEARQRLRWLDGRSEGLGQSHGLRWLPRISPAPDGFVVDPETFHHNVVSIIRQVLRSRAPISTMVVQLRWLNGSTPSLPSHLWVRIEDYLSRTLRDTDVIGCLGDGTYAAVLPGQNPNEAMIPARRLAALDWSRVLPRRDGVLTATVGVAGSHLPFDGSYDFFAQADYAARWPSKPGQAQAFCHDGERLVPPWWSPIEGAKRFDYGVRLWELLPGLFSVPFSDRRFERHLSVIGELLPHSDDNRGRVMAHICDTLAQALEIPVMPRRVLWRACRLHGLTSGLAIPFDDQGVAEGRKFGVNGSSQFLEPIIGLRRERIILADAYRDRLRTSYTPLTRSSRLYLCSRIFEVVDHFYDLLGTLADGRTLEDIGESMLDGAHWRFEPTVVRSFVDWLRSEGEEFFP